MGLGSSAPAASDFWKEKANSMSIAAVTSGDFRCLRASHVAEGLGDAWQAPDGGDHGQEGEEDGCAVANGEEGSADKGEAERFAEWFPGDESDDGEAGAEEKEQCYAPSGAGAPRGVVSDFDGDVLACGDDRGGVFEGFGTCVGCVCCFHCEDGGDGDEDDSADRGDVSRVRLCIAGCESEADDSQE